MKKYVIAMTGTVGTREDLTCEINECEVEFYESQEAENLTREDVFEIYLEERLIIEVEKDEQGNWVEVV